MFRGVPGFLALFQVFRGVPWYSGVPCFGVPGITTCPSRRLLQLQVKLQLETQNGQLTISLFIAAIICTWRYKNKKILKWSELKFSFNVKSWIKLLFKGLLSTKLFKCEYHKQSQYSVSAKRIVSAFTICCDH